MSQHTELIEGLRKACEDGLPEKLSFAAASTFTPATSITSRT